MNFIIPRWSTYNPNFYYYTNMDVDHSILLITEDEKVIYVNEMNYELCNEKLGRKFNVKKMNLKGIKEDLKGRKGTYLIDGSIPTNLFIQLRNKNIKVDNNQIKKSREVKKKGEIEKLSVAAKFSREIIEGRKVVGKMESEIRREVLVETFKKDYAISFEPIIANSLNARFPHYNQYSSKINDYCLIDYGVEYERYKGDITRCLGNLKERKGEYETLQNVVYEIADSSYAGMEIKDFIKHVDKLIFKNKLERFQHSIGHGIGLEVHEYPSLNLRSEGILKENSVITLEPGQYKNTYGLRYEDMFVVGKRKLKRI